MAARAAQKLNSSGDVPEQGWPQRFTTVFRRRTALSTVTEVAEDGPYSKDQGGDSIRKLRPEMIRRMDDPPKLVDPNGWISEEQTEHNIQVSAINSNCQSVPGDNDSSTSLSNVPPNQVPGKDAIDEHQIKMPVNSKLPVSYVPVICNSYRATYLT